ncbi:MAG: Brp/Blh family beta-carotene 15,15'-dioxygenase [Gammaproteobacteria bacterium]|nr:Brp/Blh family beta-carotene 15,15'-dioxygenase [Gammaproteobacteria bacterium]
MSFEAKLIPLFFALFIINACYPLLTPSQIIIIQMFFLITIGLFHGAYDFHYAMITLPLRSFKNQLIFISQYMLIAFLFSLFWLYFPNIGFVIFFWIACIHFGQDWCSKRNNFLQMSYGFSILAISFHTHTIVTQEILTLYFPNLSLKLVYAIMQTTPFFISASLYHLATSKKWEALIIWVSFLFLGLYLEPFSFFALYFCGFHSLKHIRHMRKVLHSVKHHDVMAGMLWLITTMIFLVGYLYDPSVIKHYPINTYLILLAGLTMPHMWLHQIQSHNH